VFAAQQANSKRQDVALFPHNARYQILRSYWQEGHRQAFSCRYQNIVLLQDGQRFFWIVGSRSLTMDANGSTKKED